MTPIAMKKRRNALKMTQIDVAIAVGVSVPAYRLWEAGGTKPTPENAAKLQRVLGGKNNANTDSGAKK